MSRYLEARQMSAKIVREFLTGQLRALPQHQRRPDDFPEAFIRQAENGHFVHSGVSIYRRLDFQATYILTTAYDDLLDPVNNVKKPLVIQLTHIP